jgi:hypothetical protein
VPVNGAHNVFDSMPQVSLGRAILIFHNKTTKWETRKAFCFERGHEIFSEQIGYFEINGSDRIEYGSNYKYFIIFMTLSNLTH